MRRACDVLRATGLPPLPLEDDGVQREYRKVEAGRPLRPILMTATDGGARVVDGFHRLSLVNHVDPDSDVPVVEATDLSNPKRGSDKDG